MNTYCFFRRSRSVGVLLLLLGLIASSLVLSPPTFAQSRQRTLATPTESSQEPVVFVHGIDPAAIPPGLPNFIQDFMDSKAIGCKQYWGDTLRYMRSNTHGPLNWTGNDFRTLKFFNGDKDCSNGSEQNHSSDLHDGEYATHCSSYPQGYNSRDDGTWNEDIYHLSCLFAWYIYTNFGANGNIKIVAHSMGGLIVHNALYQVQYRSQLGNGVFPPTLGHISEIVDFNSPHAGHTLHPLLTLPCLLVTECRQMDPNSTFTQEMLSDRAQNSQAGETDWTLIGSECDQVVSAASATSLKGVGHKVIYSSGKGGTCYDHGGALHDQLDASDARQYACERQESSIACNNPRYLNFPFVGMGDRSLYSMLR